MWGTHASAEIAHGQSTWETTLLGRDINLNAVAATDASAVYLYDKTLDVNWLRDANANVTGKVIGETQFLVAAARLARYAANHTTDCNDTRHVPQ